MSNAINYSNNGVKHTDECVPCDTAATATLLNNGAYPVRNDKKLLEKINTQKVAKKLVSEFADLAKAQGGFSPVKVTDIVDRVFS